jgi:cytochrome c551/c552
MKKILKPAVVAFGLMAMSATASAFSTDPCKNCHAIDHVVIGPAWESVAEAYGNPQALAKVFKSGFKVGDRKFASDPAFKSKASIMSLMFLQYIKGHEDDAAKALFNAVKTGKM